MDYNNFFSSFCEQLEQKDQPEIVEDKSGINYVLMVIQNQLSIKDIDFNNFTLSNAASVYSDLASLITDEDMEGRIAIDPKHAFTRLLSLSEKISAIGDTPKKRIPSPYMFI